MKAQPQLDTKQRMNKRMTDKAQNEKEDGYAVDLQRGVRPPCCYNCKHIDYTPPSPDQPYPEIWCKRGVWHGVEDKETLLLETDCKLHKRAV